MIFLIQNENMMYILIRKTDSIRKHDKVGNSPSQLVYESTQKQVQ